MNVDPWLGNRFNLSKNEIIKCFEDDFVKKDALPDSDAYVAVLERKLARIKQGKPQIEKALLESLENKRRDCIVRLLAEDFTVDDNDVVKEDDIPTKWLRSYINPQQPLTVGELVELVKADYLAKSVEDAIKSEQGASRGIGKTIAVEFCKLFNSNSEIKLIARSKNGLNETAEAISNINNNIVTQCIEYDLSLPKIESFKEFVTPKQNNSFDIYILVHNAGTEGNGCLTKDMSDLEEWQKYMSLNFFSLSLLTSAFLTANTSGHRLILNITSLAAIQPFKSLGYYCVGKAARETYLRTLAEENKDLDILNYAPGPVETAMIDRVINCVQDKDVKDFFVTMKDKNTLVKVEHTVAKLIDILEKSKYTSGARIDYYDE